MTSQQQPLFDSAPPAWELDDELLRVASVVLVEGPPQPLDYLVPDRLIDDVEPGRRVWVPLGRANRRVEGYCVAVGMQGVANRRLKEVLAIIDPAPLLRLAMIELTRWISEHYLCPWGQVLETCLPAGVRSQAGTRETVFVALAAGVAEQLPRLKLPPKQSLLAKHLAQLSAPIAQADLLAAVKATPQPLAELVKKGIVVVSRKRVATGAPHWTAQVRESRLQMNDDQQRALDAILKAIASRSSRTVLVHGVTGSGKTEVYLQAIQSVVEQGRQALVLVPEISLTPQAQARFRSRFGEVAVLHSHQSDVERHRQWQRIAQGEVPVIIGARSAIFAPAPSLGLIVVDEEHESSFKQGESPRYHARDVALRRAEIEKIPLVLGSATPALESYHRALSGEFELVSMPQRVLSRPLPLVGTIDLRAEFQDRRNRGSISRVLVQAMESTLREAGQVILLLNRRGYSTHIQCPACGGVVKCPHCSISLTHHLVQEIAICHYCDHRQPAPSVCPECQYPGIRYGGLGTQRLEAEVKARFPEATCLRMDTDTMQKPGSHERALAAFHAGEVQILLGTQMIAKGLDFPNVTLVGVINADTALHLPDFRAAERTFQLVTQVAGRTGRGERGGRVLVQTFCPEHPAIVAATRHDFKLFAKQELPIRETLCYPPYAAMARIVVRGPEEKIAEAQAMQIGERLRAQIAAQGLVARVLGPAPAPISKLRGLYRFQLQTQAVDGAGLRAAVATMIEPMTPPEGVQWMIDIDPIEML